jgi:hypothetical protein
MTTMNPYRLLLNELEADTHRSDEVAALMYLLPLWADEWDDLLDDEVLDPPAYENAYSEIHRRVSELPSSKLKTRMAKYTARLVNRRKTAAFTPD